MAHVARLDVDLTAAGGAASRELVTTRASDLGHVVRGVNVGLHGASVLSLRSPGRLCPLRTVAGTGTWPMKQCAMPRHSHRIGSTRFPGRPYPEGPPASRRRLLFESSPDDPVHRHP